MANYNTALLSATTVQKSVNVTGTGGSSGGGGGPAPTVGQLWPRAH